MSVKNWSLKQKGFHLTIPRGILIQGSRSPGADENNQNSSKILDSISNDIGNNNDSQQLEHSEINVTTYPSIRGTSTAKLPYTNVLYTNARSLTRGSKRDELKMLIDNHDIAIIGISET